MKYRANNLDFQKDPTPAIKQLNIMLHDEFGTFGERLQIKVGWVRSISKFLRR
jgi:hypothetical protein